MKRIISIILLCTLSVFATAQKTQTPATPNQKPDVILKVNGDELSGKVLEMGDSNFKFSYAGETLVYTIKKMDVLKITYGSGRVEVFNKEPRYDNNQSPSGQTAIPAKFDNNVVVSTADRHNRIAILPFGFVKDGESAADELSFKVQNECFSMLSAHAPTLTALDPRTTNAMLIKAGVNKETIKGFTSADLCNILGVEYVMDGTVMLDKTNQTTSGSSNYQSSSTNNNGKNKDKYSSSSSSSYTSYQNYQTTISMSIYNDKGASIFNQNRKSFWTDQNAYKNALEYLMKKTPFYQK